MPVSPGDPDYFDILRRHREEAAMGKPAKKKFQPARPPKPGGKRGRKKEDKR